MRLYVTPDGKPRRLGQQDIVCFRFQEAIDRAAEGDEIHLLPGVYDEPVAILGKRASQERPIVIMSDGCATLDGRRNVLRPPGMPRLEDYAFIKIKNCVGIVIENTTIQNVWPTAIYIEDSQQITVRRLNLNGATYGIFARGPTTRSILLEHCSWIQDTRIWQEVLWKDIHAPPLPRRELDGDFFRSDDIAGEVIVRYNFIAQAFNGIHLFASEEMAEHGGVNENVWIYRNTFAFIRDSAVEAERSAMNWWVFENIIYNCHTWFAFEECQGGYWYVFGNRGWFDRKPGPQGDCNTGGAVIKTNKVKDGQEDKILPSYPFYMFNNSWYVRSAYLKKGKLRRFQHFNNAIAYARPDHHPPGIVDLGRRMIGVGAPNPACEGVADAEEPFTTEWERLRILFENDICSHPDYPDNLNRIGYPVRGIYADPGFGSGRDGNFILRDDSPCREAGCGRMLELPEGRTWDLPASLHIGAMNGDVPYSPLVLNCPVEALPEGYIDDPKA
jgi:hypothetical protein